MLNIIDFHFILTVSGFEIHQTNKQKNSTLVKAIVDH
jgi:hypothetical protein